MRSGYCGSTRDIAGVALIAALAGCGVGYSNTPARLVLTDREGISVSDLRNAMGPVLEADGFDDLGRDDEMIALVRGTAPDEETGVRRVADLLHRYTYLSKRRDLRV